MLSMLEEVVLLAVDEKTGGLRSTREFGTAYALVGAVFFDLHGVWIVRDDGREAASDEMPGELFRIVLGQRNPNSETQTARNG